MLFLWNLIFQIVWFLDFRLFDLQHSSVWKQNILEYGDTLPD